MEHEILVDFDPLRITLPGPGPFVGKVRIVLPELHVKLWDLSMGIRELDGAHIGGDARMWEVSFNAPEPGIMAGDLTQFITDAQEELKRVHTIVQGELDKRFLMGKDRITS